jgi:hypothetical protein
MKSGVISEIQTQSRREWDGFRNRNERGDGDATEQTWTAQTNLWRHRYNVNGAIFEIPCSINQLATRS